MDYFTKRAARERKRRQIKTAAVTALIAVAVLSISFLVVKSGIFSRFSKKQADYNNTLTVINTGQAKCTLVESDGHFILIDCGNTGETENILEYLKSRNVKKIDLFVITHFHYDHTSQFVELMNEFGTKTVLIPQLSEENTPTTRFYKKLTESGKKDEYKLVTAAEGDEYQIGECTLTVLSDTVNMTREDTSDSDKRINNTSVCMSVSLGDFVFIETGDAESEIEKMIIDTVPENVTVFNASHHGSADSNTTEFMSKLNPRYITISCGENNEYSHPAKGFTDRVEALGIPMIVTYEYGNIVFSMTDNELNTKLH